MKPRKKKAIMAGLLAASAALMSGCGTGPAPALYGPPPATPSASFEPENNIPETVYGPPEMLDPQFVPEENIPEDVYGPPMFFESPEAEPSSAPADENP
ncbi:MAG: hypothetical protein IJV30_00140 [Oscillospiraceae bacterium]|nr:hypothetical protein [Oscillospiraceae bacterium]